MSVVTSKTFFPAFIKTLGILFFYILIGLFIDSVYVTENFGESQWVANIVMVIVFTVTCFKVSPRIREQLFYAVLLGFFGEYLFSVAMGMYTYRLENVPHYIPMGHALVYAGVLFFMKTAFTKNNHQKLEKILTVIIILYATLFLIFRNDVFGFVMTAGTLLILIKKPRERLFYLTMYLAVAFLEIVGTTYECWWWPATAWGIFDFLPSHNPPTGISFFYFLLDLGTLWFYKKRHKAAWLRMKNIRKIRLNLSKATN
ncbi:hypothetical protein QWY81_14910 [Polaribacter undariae]|uniref:Uncharacterized protein n=1 Tax=Polaribacter sejongensis TaxID=985043 RepID=A0AAJ1VHU6_9FLAO|nr:hypothetical protein [Polaribacter undariae]MDN3620754.1 hypothetical protein [Polaribacter undariae]UWD31354.1 hypothetical protein NQP51_14590 [Polaribacter undariae]